MLKSKGGDVPTSSTRIKCPHPPYALAPRHCRAEKERIPKKLHLAHRAGQAMLNDVIESVVFKTVKPENAMIKSALPKIK